MEVETDKTTMITTQYRKTYLLVQRESILKQRAEQMAQRDVEVAEVDALLAEAANLGIKEDEPNPVK